MNLVAVITKENLKKQLKIVFNNSSYLSFIEIRLDTFYPINYNSLENLLKEIKSKNFKTIITFRHFSEGGKINISENEREKIICSLVSQNTKLIDYIDIECLSKIKDNIISIAKRYNKKVILSTHFLSKNEKENLSKLENCLFKMTKFTKNKNLFLKIVMNIDNFNNYIKLTKIVFKTFKNFKKVTLFTTGKTSFVSRLIGCLLNMPFVYITPEKPVISTQPNIQSFLTGIKLIGLK